MFIESSWQEAVVALLTAINAILGAPDYRQPIRPFVASDLPTIALSLQDRSYRPASWFAQAPAQHISALPSTQAPSAFSADQYDIIIYTAQPSGLAMVSSRSGGIIYLDPFYALLASFNLGHLGSLHAEVRVSISNRTQPWSQRQAIVLELRQGTYRPDRYFTLTNGAPTRPGESAVTLGKLSRQDLSELEICGMTEAIRVDSRGAMRYLLYRYVAH
jgi:hypothetical protein